MTLPSLPVQLENQGRFERFTDRRWARIVLGGKGAGFPENRLEHACGALLRIPLGMSSVFTFLCVGPGRCSAKSRPRRVAIAWASNGSRRATSSHGCASPHRVAISATRGSAWASSARFEVTMLRVLCWNGTCPDRSRLGATRDGSVVCSLARLVLLGAGLGHVECYRLRGRGRLRLRRLHAGSL